MIDRGALLLGPRAGSTYRGVHRPPLDAQEFTGRRGKDLGRSYADLIVAGEGVIEDLDDALALLERAHKIGLTEVELIVFEIPQEPAPAPKSLPIATVPPAEGLVLLGYDVIEPIEPFWSPLDTTQPPVAVNAAGLIDRRSEADALAKKLNAEEREDPVVAVRVWRVGTT